MPIATSTCVDIFAAGVGTTTCTYDGISTSTPPSYDGVITAGDVLVSFFLFLILTLQIIGMTLKSV